MGGERRRSSAGGFSEAFRTAPIIMIVTSAEDGRFIAVNDEFVRITGYSGEEIAGRSSDTFRVWRDPEQRARIMAQVLEHGSVAGLEEQYISKTGETIRGIVSATRAVFDGRDCVIWHVIDVTAQRRTESELYARTQHLQAVVSSLDRYPVSIIDRNGVIQTIFGGDAQRRSGERTPEELRGHRLIDIVEPEVARRLTGAVDEVFETGEAREIQFRSSDTEIARELSAWFSPIRGTNGEVEAILSVTRDITDRLQDAEALEQLSGTWRSMIEEVPDLMAEGVIILDAEHAVVWMNRAFERFFGLRRVEVGGVDYRQLVRERILGVLFDADAFLARVLAAQSHESEVTRFICHVRKTAHLDERWLECTSVPLRTGVLAGGRIERFADITPGKIAEGLLRRLNLELRKARSLESKRSSPDAIDPALREALDGSSRIVAELQAVIRSPYVYGSKTAR